MTCRRRRRTRRWGRPCRCWMRMKKRRKRPEIRASRFAAAVGGVAAVAAAAATASWPVRPGRPVKPIRDRRRLRRCSIRRLAIRRDRRLLHRPAGPPMASFPSATWPGPTVAETTLWCRPFSLIQKTQQTNRPQTNTHSTLSLVSSLTLDVIHHLCVASFTIWIRKRRDWWKLWRVIPSRAQTQTVTP